VAREAADAWTTDDHPRFVLGSVGPGTKLPSLGHSPFAALRDAYAEQVAGMIEGSIDAVLGRDRSRPAAGEIRGDRAHRAMDAAGVRLPVLVSITVETTGTMLLGTEIGAALCALEALGIDAIGLNCATGPAEMSEHLRHLSRQASIALNVHAERRPAATDPGRRQLPAQPGPVGPGAHDLHPRLRAFAGRRLLRDHPGASASGRRGRARPGPRPASSAP